MTDELYRYEGEESIKAVPDAVTQNISTAASPTDDTAEFDGFFINSQTPIDDNIVLLLGYEKYRIHKRLILWYAHINMLPVEIMNQLAGFCRFLVSGEGLLLYALNLSLNFFNSNASAMLDDQTTMNWNARSVSTAKCNSCMNLQVLHVVYCFENLLQQLKECNGTFTVVFFDCFKPYLDIVIEEDTSGFIWLVRQVLVLHLTILKYALEHQSGYMDSEGMKHGSAIDFVLFRHWYNDPEWINFLRSSRPAFFLVDDGSCAMPVESHFNDLDVQGLIDDLSSENSSDNPTPSTVKSILNEEEKFVGVLNFDPQNINNIRSLPYTLILSTLQYGLSVGVFYRLRKVGRKYMGFGIFPSYYVSALNEQACDMYSSVEVDKIECKFHVADYENIFNYFKNLEFFSANPLSIREVLVIHTLISNLIASDDVGEELLLCLETVAKVFLIFEVVIKNTPLLERAHRGTTLEGSNLVGTFPFMVSFFLNSFQECIGSLINDVKNSEKISEKKLQSFFQECRIESKDVSDLFDGHLLTTFVAFIFSISDNDWMVHGLFLNILPGSNESQRLSAIWDFVISEGITNLSKRDKKKSAFFPINLFPLFDTPYDPTKNIPKLPDPQNISYEPSPLYDIKSFLLDKILSGKKSSDLPNVKIVPPKPNLTNDHAGLPVVLFNRLSIRRKWQRADDLRSIPPPVKQAERLGSYQVKKLQDRIIQRILQRGEDTVLKQALSVLGSNSLFRAVVVNRLNHPWCTENEANDSKKKPHKVTNKMAALIRQNEIDQMSRTKLRDESLFNSLEKKLSDVFTKIDSPDSFKSVLLGTLAGYNRTVDSFVDFPAVQDIFKTKEIQLLYLLRVLTHAMKTLKFFKLEVQKKSTTRIGIFHCFSILFRIVHEMYDSYKDKLDGKAMYALQEALCSIGFINSASLLFDRWAEVQISRKGDVEENMSNCSKKKPGGKGKEEKNKKQKDTKKKELVISVDEIKKETEKYRFPISALSPCTDVLVNPCREKEFELEFMGIDMKRTLDGAPDNRVLFIPDKWQRVLLDIVDKGESALVCAPTSCGKTFICYYAMDLVLRFDDKSVVVYVSPSKALVNQVFLDIYSRFSSKNFSTPSTFLKGVIVKDYEVGPIEKCQILVADPFMFESILTDPCSRPFISRIKFVIFDEVHCIGSFTEGSIWERLIQLIPSPFLALSATVGNPNSFYAWLQRVKNNVEGVPHKIHLIQQFERYSDLYPQLYTKECLYPLHPLAFLDYNDIMSQGLPEDFYLTPPDAMTCFRVLEIHCGSVVEDLRPSIFFSNKPAISKSDLISYVKAIRCRIYDLVSSGTVNEAGFKAIVQDIINWMASYDRGTSVSDLKDLLDRKIVIEIARSEFSVKNFQQILKTSDEPKRSNLASAEEANNSFLINELKTTRGDRTHFDGQKFFRMCKTLEKHDMLPVIVFNMSEMEVLAMFNSVVSELDRSQYEKYYGSAERAAATRLENKRRMDVYLETVARLKMQSKLKGMSREQREQQGLEDDFEESEDVPPPPKDIADEYDEEFSFANRKVMGSHREEVENTITKLKYRDIRTAQKQSRVISGLRRGIGMHHDLMSRRGREAVELLFRLGFLRVVFSTKTLALGIHMPCRTVLFAGDHIALTPLLYKQMSGRAGRRGFDNKGNVVFWNIPFTKISRLLGSRLPVVSGQIPASNSLVIRILSLHSNLIKCSNPLGYTEEYVAKIFQDPLYSVTNSDKPCTPQELIKLRMVVGYRVRFIFDLLYDQSLIDSNSNPIGHSGLVDSLLHFETGNLGFNFLMLKGILDKLDRSSCRSFILQLISVLFIPMYATHTTIAKKLIFYYGIRLSNTLRSADENFVDYSSYSTSIITTAFSRKRFGESIKIPTYCPVSFPLIPVFEENVLNCIKQINVQVIKKTIEAARCCGKNFKWSDENFRLPFSGIYVNAEMSDSYQRSEFYEAYKSNVIQYYIRSPFAALCGKGDYNFDDSEELCTFSRTELCLTVDTIPTIADVQVVDGCFLQNSFIADFFTHKNLSSIGNDNCLPVSERWHLLKGCVELLRWFKEYFEPYDKNLCDIFGDLFKELRVSHKATNA